MTNKVCTKWLAVALAFGWAVTNGTAIAFAASVAKKPSIDIQAVIKSADEASTNGDYWTALDLYRQAAEKGDARAQSAVGIMYFDSDPKGAVKWFKLAAAQGYAEAEFRLGWIYANGTGVPRDENEAAKWYQLAAAQGHKEAQYALGIKTRSTLAQETRYEEQNVVAVPIRPGDMSAAIAAVQMNFDRADCPSVIRTQRFSDGTVKVICSNDEDFRVDFSGPFAKLASKPVAIRCSAVRDMGIGC
jgi:Sel1 repeat